MAYVPLKTLAGVIVHLEDVLQWLEDYADKFDAMSDPVGYQEAKRRAKIVRWAIGWLTHLSPNASTKLRR